MPSENKNYATKIAAFVRGLKTAVWELRNLLPKPHILQKYSKYY